MGLKVYPPATGSAPATLPATTTAGFEWPNPGDPTFVEIPAGSGAFLTTGRRVFVNDGSHAGLMTVDTLYPVDPELPPGTQIVTLINWVQPVASTVIGTASIAAIEES